ncbi:hypothetical protein LXA43DRAFT_583603 [Ganoderma leucocontextum]|nr:hypothetical protein LXA43DRAFT_583603 [Ganoderma leucocontextum]
MSTMLGDPVLADPRCSNIDQPIFKVPVEILAMIVHHLLLPFGGQTDGFIPYWKCSIRDCSPLLPVALTCHRLRDVVDSLPQVVKGIVIKEAQHISTKVTQPQSKDASLSVYIALGSNIPPALRDWYSIEAHRIHELHLTRLGHIAMDFWAPLLLFPTPKLRMLSLTSPGGSWLPPNGVFLPFPGQPSSLRCLTLKRMCFLPSNPPSSLAHVALFDVYIPKADSNLLKFLSLCPNLESLVLSNIRDGPGRDSNIPPVHLPQLRRITLHKLPRHKAALYLTHLPRNKGQAVQLLEHHTTREGWPPQYPPDAHTLCFGHCLVRENTEPTFELEAGVLAVTFLGAHDTFHVTLPIRHTIYSLYDLPVTLDVVMRKESLAGVREAWAVGIHPTRPVGDVTGDDGTAVPPERHRLAVIVRSVIIELGALDTLVLVFRHSLEPNLYMLPNAQDPSFVSRNLKTVRLVLCHGLSQSPSDLTVDSMCLSKRPKVVLGTVCQGLACGQYAYIETLILEIGPHVIVDDADLLQLSKHVPTVRVGRIRTIPQVALPEACKEPAADRAWIGSLW